MFAPALVDSEHKRLVCISQGCSGSGTRGHERCAGLTTLWLKGAGVEEKGEGSRVM